MDMVTRVQTIDEDDFISPNANTVRKGMKLTVLFPIVYKF